MKIIIHKDNLSFMYINMDALKQEISEEMDKLRIDKTRLYSILLKMVDNCGGSGGPGSQGPPGPAGPAGPPGPAGECKCATTKPKATTTKKTTTKKASVA
jgi:hypothetical protein